MSKPRDDLYGTTLQAFIAQLQPREWNLPAEKWGPPGPDRENHYNNRWDYAKFFDWPPDAFLLTSLLLEITGAYRAAATLHRSEAWPRPDWGAVCCEAATQWRKWLCRDDLDEPLPGVIRKYADIIDRCRDTYLNDLYDVASESYGRSEIGEAAWELCCCLMELHAIADETMRGVGTVYSPRLSLTLDRFGVDGAAAACSGIERVHMMANVLLTLRGTLSRIGKHRGIVLPKTRTPQVGLTIRTFSHYLSFHQTEVDVAWRAVPWTNIDENTVNALIVPSPYQIDASDFRPELAPQSFRRLGNIRYFSYEPGRQTPNRFNPAAIVEAVRARRETNRVHLIVFPEAALRVEHLQQLKEALADALRPHEMPLIICGLAGQSSDDGSDTTNFNRVCLSTFFGQKWYDMTQDKHHRWRLDPRQIANYRLAGVLSGTRNWWESIPIPRRRLSFLTSNAWLTLAPLICEDLARLDPVSDLIRGVGPTLLIALLLDGPQLTNRWPARYAGVFAEDPGTSVLTVTALGMSQRSLPGDVPKEIAEKSMRSVALWKDQFTGWKVIDVSMSQPLAMLTVATQWIDDDTVDSRSEPEKSAVFVLQGLQLADACDGAAAAPVEPAEPAQSAEQADAAATAVQVDSDSERLALLDMCELSLYTFFIDALVDSLEGNEDRTLALMRMAVGCRDEEPEGGSSPAHSSANSEIAELSLYSIWTRRSVPKDIPTPQFLFAMTDATELVKKARAARTAEQRRAEQTDWDEPWAALVHAAVRELEERARRLTADDPRLEDALAEWARVARADAEKAHETRLQHDARGRTLYEESRIFFSEDELRRNLRRILITTPGSILWAVHNRLSIVRRAGQLRSAHASLLNLVEKALESPLHQTGRKRPARATAG